MVGEILSWICGIISSIVWLFVFIPQIIEILQCRSVEAISFYLILFWLIGDMLSLQSAIHLEVNNLIVYTGIFQIAFDLFFIIQWLMYKCIEVHEIDKIVFDSSKRRENSELSYMSLPYNCVGIEDFVKKISKQKETCIFIGTLTGLLMTNILLNITESKYMAIGLAWISAVAFSLARIPQIVLNNRRKSVAGLSYLTFALVLIANAFYIVSLLIKLLDINDVEGRNEYVIENLSWIMGTSISILLNSVILVQFRMYWSTSNGYIEIY